MTSRKPGRPAHEPTDTTRRQVEMLKGLLLKDDEIAAVIGICDETLRKYYGPELATGKAKVVAQVGNALVRRALGDGPDAVNAAKFYLERAGEWTQRIEASGKDGAPLAPVINVTVGRTEP